jgi:hypothetical protein
MFRIKVIVLTALGVLVAMAVASASASAAACTSEETKDDVCLQIEGNEAGAEVVPFTSAKKAGTVSKLIVTNGPEIECAAATNEGEFDNTVDSKLHISDLKITFSTCTVTNATATCEVKEPIVADGGGDGIDSEEPMKSPKEVTFKPSEGITFATITVKSKPGKTCLFATVAKVTGEQTATLPGSETEAETHEVVAAASGSNLKYAEKPATFELAELVKLSGAFAGKKFSLHQS